MLVAQISANISIIAFFIAIVLRNTRPEKSDAQDLVLRITLSYRLYSGVNFAFFFYFHVFTFFSPVLVPRVAARCRDSR